ncbi:RipA family octameric membrane protein [Angustibacter sp. McL0619]|uniref:RipA family octameric membrane protein n=1 Tax=Angustibacter sp. McL0619 TaxID=3415676 RepID=UPI003CED0E4C
MALEDRLWNEDALARYGGDRAAQQGALLEQYKLYVEMADRVSQRRGLTNTFFLTLNTAIFALVAALRSGRPEQPWWLAFPLTALLGQCLAWFWLVRSYRLLNTAKYEVVRLLETRLPASPYARGEWRALDEGKGLRRYWPLTYIETCIPILFALTYLAAFVAVLSA